MKTKIINKEVYREMVYKYLVLEKVVLYIVVSVLDELKLKKCPIVFFVGHLKRT